MPIEARIYRLAALCVALGIAALIVPRFVPNPEGGFAGAASAILVLFVLLGLALLCSLYLLGLTVRRIDGLSTLARIAGIGPSVVFALTLLVLFGFLRY